MAERPEYIDIHAHANFPAYDADRKEVIDRALAENVWMINVGTAEETSSSAISLANDYKSGLYAAIGLHPVHTRPSWHDANEFKVKKKSATHEFNVERFKELANDKKVVAIGECGLDFFHIEDAEAKKKQVNVFEKQIELSLELGLPLMIHCRNAYQEALDMLASYKKDRPALCGDIHFFAGSWQEARAFLDLGFTLSFTGVITFARNYDEVIQNAPLNMIMSETDCPYVTPAPYRGKRNEPLYVKEVVAKIAEIRGEELTLVKPALVENAFRVFKL